MSDLPARRDEQRASDGDRDVVAGDLRDAFTEGRLDPDEYQRRLDAVWQARTYGELDRLTEDLPEPGQRKKVEAAAKGRQNDVAEYLGEWKSWLGGAVIMIGIWFFTNLNNDEWGNFWPGIPLGIWAVILIASAFGDDKKKKG